MRKKTIERYFVIIALVFGMLMLYITPPLASPDERSHFLNSYGISQGIGISSQENVMGRYYPNDVVDFANEYWSPYHLDRSLRYSYNQNDHDAWTSYNLDSEVFLDHSAIETNPLGYILPVTGMTLFRGASVLGGVQNPYNYMLVGRFFNLLGYILLAYYAIKITPIFKKIMFILALTPINLFLAASVSYDAILISSSFLLFSYTFYLYYQKEKIRAKDYMVICFIAIVFSAVKQAYLPLFLILLILPPAMFGDIKKYVQALFLVVFIVAGVYLVNSLHMGQFNIVNDNTGINTQLDYLQENPFLLIKMIGSQLLSRAYLPSFFGQVGELDAITPPLFVTIYYVVLISIIFYEVLLMVEKIPVLAKLYGLIGSFISIIIIFAAHFITWNPKIGSLRENHVLGIQGRYFMPLVLFIFILFANLIPSVYVDRFKKKMIYKKIKYLSNQLILFSAVTSSASVVIALFLRYRVS